MDCYVDADSDCGTPLAIAVDNGDIEMVKLLLSYDAHPDADGSGGTSLHRAARDGDPHIMRLLLWRMKRAEIEEEWDGDYPHVDVLSDYPDFANGVTPLHVAADEGNLSCVKLLISAGANVNAIDDEGETPLSKSLKQGHKDVANLLRRYGAVQLKKRKIANRSKKRFGKR